MRLVSGAGLDPTPQDRALRFGHAVRGDFDRRHPEIWIFGGDTLPDEALVRMSRHQSALAAVAPRGRGLELIQSEIGLSRGVIRPVAAEAVSTQNRANVAAIAWGGILGGDGRCAEENEPYPGIPS